MAGFTAKVVAAAYLYEMMARKKKRKRRFCVHPLNIQRDLKGAFETLYADLREDETKFFNYFRMSPKSLDELFRKVESHFHITRNHSMPISPMERLCVTLRYLASGNTFTDLHYTYRMGITTISKIVREVCMMLWTVLRNDCMAKPSSETWNEISLGFESKANFPNCVGAVDGKHIRLVKPQHSGSLSTNYKHFFSICLMAICDANYCFTFIDVGAYGRNCDSTVFSNSLFWCKMANGMLDIPPPKPLPGTVNPIIPHILVADEAFSLSEHVLRPYSKKHLNHNKRIFNYRLTQARRYIECTFGILSNKWQIFHRPLNVDTNLAVDIVKACCVLHNFTRIRDGFNYEDTLTVVGFEDFRPGPCNRAIGMSNASIRDHFSQYFMDVGSVPWQESNI